MLLSSEFWSSMARLCFFIPNSYFWISSWKSSEVNTSVNDWAPQTVICTWCSILVEWSNEVLRLILYDKNKILLCRGKHWLIVRLITCLMSVALSALLEMVTVCMIYKDSITLMSICSVTWARFMSVWISVEDSHVRLYKYCSLLLYLLSVVQISCAVVSDFWY